MKIPPQVIDGMTFADFYCFVSGYAKAHSAEDKSDVPSEAEYMRVLMEEQAAGRA